MGYTVIAPVGDNLKALFVGMKEFPTERVILIAQSHKLGEARDLVKKLKDFTIKSKIIEIEGSVMDEMFKTFGHIVSIYNNDNLVVNVATGDRITTCAALSAAFANGLKAFGIAGDKTMLLPIMKLSYYNELSENKLKILKSLEGKKLIALNKLAEQLNMSISLLSYHINGNYKYKGLKEFRLVEVVNESKHVKVRLSQMGNLLLKGYIKHRGENA